LKLFAPVEQLQTFFEHLQNISDFYVPLFEVSYNCLSNVEHLVPSYDRDFAGKPQIQVYQQCSILAGRNMTADIVT